MLLRNQSNHKKQTNKLPICSHKLLATKFNSKNCFPKTEMWHQGPRLGVLCQLTEESAPEKTFKILKLCKTCAESRRGRSSNWHRQQFGRPSHHSHFLLPLSLLLLLLLLHLLLLLQHAGGQRRLLAFLKGESSVKTLHLCTISCQNYDPTSTKNTVMFNFLCCIFFAFLVFLIFSSFILLVHFVKS